MARRSNNTDRDEEGRFTSRDDEGSRGRSYYSRSNRDEDEGDYRFSSHSGNGSGRSHGGWSGDSEGYAEAGRHSHGGRSRYEEDYGDDRSSRSRGGSIGRERDDEGRFVSNRDGDNGRGRSSHSGNDSEHGGWFGDSERHAEASRRGWQEGHRSQRGGDSRYDQNEDDHRSSRSSRNGGGRSHGGWFGDSEGHAEAARQRRY